MILINSVLDGVPGRVAVFEESDGTHPVTAEMHGCAPVFRQDGRWHAYRDYNGDALTLVEMFGPLSNKGFFGAPIGGFAPDGIPAPYNSRVRDNEDDEDEPAPDPVRPWPEVKPEVVAVPVVEEKMAKSSTKKESTKADLFPNGTWRGISSTFARNNHVPALNVGGSSLIANACDGSLDPLAMGRLQTLANIEAEGIDVPDGCRLLKAGEVIPTNAIVAERMCGTPTGKWIPTIMAGWAVLGWGLTRGPYAVPKDQAGWTSAVRLYESYQLGRGPGSGQSTIAVGGYEIPVYLARCTSFSHSEYNIFHLWFSVHDKVFVPSLDDRVADGDGRVLTMPRLMSKVERQGVSHVRRGAFLPTFIPESESDISVSASQLPATVSAAIESFPMFANTARLVFTTLGIPEPDGSTPVTKAGWLDLITRHRDSARGVKRCEGAGLLGRGVPVAFHSTGNGPSRSVERIRIPMLGHVAGTLSSTLLLDDGTDKIPDMPSHTETERLPELPNETSITVTAAGVPVSALTRRVRSRTESAIAQIRITSDTAAAVDYMRQNIPQNGRVSVRDQVRRLALHLIECGHVEIVTTERVVISESEETTSGSGELIPEERAVCDALLSDPNITQIIDHLTYGRERA